MRKMKDSGVEWIGGIPEDWDTAYLSSIFGERKHKNANMKEQNLLSLSYGKIVKKDINTSNGLLPASFEGYNIVEPGDIVLRLTDLQNDHRSLRTGLCKERGIITSAYCTLMKKSPEINSAYMQYYLHGFDICKGFYGMGAGVRQGLNFDGIRKLMMLFPDVETQDRICEYLDKKTFQIDSIVANDRVQIEALKQYKQSLISETVTRGLDPDAPMKDSGVEWIGEIPADWESARIKDVIFPREKPIFETDEIITCFRDGEVTLRRNRREDGFTLSDTENGYHGVDVGDLVIHGMDAFAGAVGCSDSRGKTTPVVHVCDTAGNNRFMYYLRFMASGNILMDLSNGVRQRSSDYRNFARLGIYGIIVPPIEAQNRIAEYLDNNCAKIDTVISLKQRKIEKLKQYRQSLIYECVTGKRDLHLKTAGGISNGNSFYADDIPEEHGSVFN